MKKKYKYIFCGLFIILVFCLSVFSINNVKNESSSISVVSSVENLSNKKIEWGLKRNKNNKQPEFLVEDRKILENNNGITIGSVVNPYIYLTFDMGYEAGYMEKILDVLKNNNVKATFFITAHYLNSQPDLVKRIIDEGHIVGNHTVNHKSMPELSIQQINDEMMNLHKAIYDKFQYEMKYMRPPKGEFSEKSINVVNSLGYRTVMWSFAYADWDEKKQPSIEDAKQKIIENLHNGEIMLLHGTSKTNSEILNDVIIKIKELGYEIKSLDEFIL